MSRARFVILFATLTAASLLQAQENRASISGQVTDSSGAAVPRAAVKIVNVEQGAIKDTSTDDAGRYQAGFLEPGEYSVTVKATGFQTLTQQHVVVVALATVAVNPKLVLGTSSQSVTVEAAPPLLHFDDATLDRAKRTCPVRRAIAPVGVGRREDLC